MRKIYLMLFSVCMAILTNGQSSSVNYTFTPIATASLTDMSAGTTQLVAPSSDDVASTVTNIGFEFWFMGTRYTQFSANSNGYVRLGGTAVGTAQYALGTAGIPLIASLGSDEMVSSTGKVHYKVTGSAPNRVLVIEFKNMTIIYDGLAILTDGTSQVRLYETTNAIELVYGSMNRNSSTGFGGGLDAQHIGFSVNNTANTLATINTADALSTAGVTANQFALGAPMASLNSVADGARKLYGFTPAGATPPSGLNFTSVGAAGMTLNWTDNSADEIGFAVYRSTDGITYSYVTTTAANAVSSAQSGLTPSTTYFWQVYAVREALSTALSGSQATTGLGNIVSTGSGLWSSTTPNAPWPGGIVPTSGDNVTIADGSTVSIDITTAAAYSVTVGQGTSGVLDYIPGTASTLTVGADVTIAAGGTIQTAATGTVVTHGLSLAGNLTNNGTLDLSTNGNTAGATLTFTGPNNSSFTGAGATTDLYILALAKSSRTQEVELNLSNFSVRGLSATATGALLTSNTGTGTLKISGTNTFSGTLWSVAGYTIPATLGFWLNNPNFTVNGQTGSPTVAGLFRVTQGTYNIGTATGNSMGFSTGSVITVEGGAINATGRFGVAAASNVITYTQSAGTITVCTVGHTSTTLASFDLGTSASSTISVSGGTVTCQIASTAASGPRDYRMQSGTGVTALTGGTLFFGNALSGAAKNFNFYGVLFRNTEITNISGNHTLTLTTTAPVTYNYLVQNLTINTGTTFTHAYAGIALYSGNIVNNGTFTATAASSRVYNFANGAATSWTGSGAFTAPMNSFEIDNILGVTLNTTNQLPTNRIILFTGAFTNSNKITLGNGGATTGIIQIGNTTTATNAGVFDAAPTFNLGTGGQTISYLRTVNPRTTSFEINPTRILSTLTVDDNDATHELSLAGGNLTISSGAAPTLTLTNGKINLNGSTITLGLDASTAALAGVFGATLNGYMYNGFFKRWVSATTGNRDFPMGIAAFKRNASINFTGAPATGGSLTAQWVSSPGGTNGLPLTEGAINVEKTSNDGYWTITSGDALSGGTYTGTFTATGISGVSDVTQLVLVKRPNSGSPWVLDGVHVTGSGTIAAPVLSRTGMSGFSDFGIGSSDINILPTGLLSFSGQKEGTVNKLRWTTLTEQNNRGFEVQRSTDGVNYTALGFVNSLAAGGSSTDALNYSFADNAPVGAKQYYRLRQVDLDNHSKLSNIVLIKGDKIITLAIGGIFPNPASTQLNVIVDAPVKDKVTLLVLDAAGRLVLQQSVYVETGSNTVPVTIGGLTNGSYLVKLVCSSTCETSAVKFVKQ